jgi:pyridoxamine 5'-phosphate oxidase
MAITNRYAAKLLLMLPEQTLPDPLPGEPMTLLADWLAEARRRSDQPNPDSMALATCDAGRPAVRVVLCKEIETGGGSLRFVTNYNSRKGRELAANPRAALVFHWDHLHRQARLEGAVDKASDGDSDAYFATRARDSQIGAHASNQSEPVESMTSLRARAEAVRERYRDRPVPRPPHWGGYVFWADSVELWVAGRARLHERARWTRELSAVCTTRSQAGPWSVTRLQP